MHSLESEYLGKMFHQYTGFSSTGSLFPNKLYRMLTDQTCLCMYWGGEGTHLVINTRAFEDELLEDTSLRWKYQLKTTSTTSFIRQLHAYGFKKVLDDLEKFGPDPNYIRRYYHPCFQEKRPELLAFMKRNVRVSGPSRKRQLLHHQQQLQHEMQQIMPSSSMHASVTDPSIKPRSFEQNPFISSQLALPAMMAPNGIYPPPSAMFMNRESCAASTSQQQQTQQNNEEETDANSSNSRKNRRKAQPRRHPSFDVRFGQGDGNGMCSTSFPFSFKANVKSDSSNKPLDLLTAGTGDRMQNMMDSYTRLVGSLSAAKQETSSAHTSGRSSPTTNQISKTPNRRTSEQQPLDLSSPVAKKAALLEEEVTQVMTQWSSDDKTSTLQNNIANNVNEKRKMSCPSPATSSSKYVLNGSPRSLTPSAAATGSSVSSNISGTNSFGNLPPRVQVPYGTMLQPAYIAWATRKIYSSEHKQWIQPRPSIIPLPIKPVAPESCPNFNFHPASNTVSAEKLVENFPHFPVASSAPTSATASGTISNSTSETATTTSKLEEGAVPMTDPSSDSSK